MAGTKDTVLVEEGGQYVLRVRQDPLLEPFYRRSGMTQFVPEVRARLERLERRGA